MNTDPIVLIAGHMCDERVFQKQIFVLSQLYSTNVIPITSYDTVESMADGILDKAPDTFALAGHSLGGIVAMQIMARQPERVTRLALLATNHRAESNKARQIRNKRMERVVNGELISVVKDEMKPAYLADTPDRDNYLDLIMKMAMDLGPDVFLRQSRAISNRPDQISTLEKIKIPTMIFYGEFDTLCPPQTHFEMVQLIKGSKLVPVINSGHMVTLEQENFMSRKLVEWMSM